MWTQLAGQPKSLDAEVWTELMQPTWAQFLDRVGTSKWQFHPFLYRPIRTWLIRIREKLNMALEVRSGATDDLKDTEDDAVRLQERLIEIWHDKTRKAEVHAILTELRDRVHRVIKELLPLMLRVYQDAMIEEAPLLTMYKDGVRKPLFLYAQELVVCLYDRISDDPILMEEKLKDIALRLSLQSYARKDLLEKIEQLHNNARRLMHLKDTDGVLWIELDSGELSSFSYFTETADQTTQDAWISQLRDIGKVIRTDEFQSKLRKRFWPLLLIE